jgi:hypothetical protein
MRDVGVNSLRELWQRTGSPERSVFKQAQIAAIDTFYRQSGGVRGPYGFPLGEAEFSGESAVRDYSGGRIGFLHHTARHVEGFAVRVRFVGFRCERESASDQLSGADEPYFIIGVIGGNTKSSTKRFGPYEDINSGTVRFEATEVASAGIGNNDNIAPPIVLGVVGMEHDWGSPEEAEAKVRKAIEDIEDKFEQAVGTFTGASTDNHVMPQWARDIYIGWVPEGATALLGLGDDEVGATPVVLFDTKAELKDLPPPPVKGMHGQNEYTHNVRIDGGDQGEYELFFKIDLVHLESEG